MLLNRTATLPQVPDAVFAPRGSRVSGHAPTDSSGEHGAIRSSDGSNSVGRRALCQRVCLAVAALALVPTAAGVVAHVVLSQGAAVAAAGGPQEPEAISLADAKAEYDRSTAVFVDARPEWLFATGHVPGALSVAAEGPGGGIPVTLDSLPRSRRLIAYCSGDGCPSSHILARRLKEQIGFTDVLVLEAGWPGWQEAGYPVAGTQVR